MNIEYLKTPEIIQPGAIKFIRKDGHNSVGYYEELSNFQKTNKISDYDYPNIFYDCVENYYQSAKTTDADTKIEISKLSAYASKKLGATLNLRDDWIVLKFQVMWLGLKQKFNQPKFKEILLSTENKQIIEWCWWGDRIWGMDSKKGIGNNALGKLLMHLRDGIK
jgi:ribA/ribD-fused uncharacterized protein